jgi:hypothetical protein
VALAACLTAPATVSFAAAHPPVEGVCIADRYVFAAWCGDGGPARRAGLVHPTALGVLPGGSLVIFDSGTTPQGHFAMVREVTPDGIIRRVAGTGEAGESGDGGPARAARIAMHSTLAGRPDGSFLIAEADSNRVRRVTPDGRIETVAGTGARGFSGEGGPATAARLDRPASVTTTPDGGYLVVDGGDGRIRRIAPDGTISTFGAVKPRNSLGQSLLRIAALTDGDVALTDGKTVRRLTPGGADATLWTIPRAANGEDSVTAVAQAADGQILATTAGGLLLRIEADAPPTRLAGTTGFRCHYPPDGGPASRLTLGFPDDLAVSGDGSAFVADWVNSRVRRIAPDGSQSLVAGGEGSRWGGGCGFGAGETDTDDWPYFNITHVRMSHTQLRLETVSSFPATVRITVRRAGRVVLRAQRRIHSGRFKLALSGHFGAGRYRVSLAGRSPSGLTSEAENEGSVR